MTEIRLIAYPVKGAFGVVSFLVLALLTSPTLYSQSKETALQALLRKQLKLTSADIAGLTQGRVLAKIIDSKEKREVVAIGVVRVNISQEEFLRRYRDISGFKQSDEVLQIGKFGDPPRVADVAGLTMESGDIEDLKSCKPGSCGLKLSAGMMARLAAGVQARSGSSDGDAKERANVAMRELLVDYVKEYQQKGDAALVTYNDAKRPLSVADDFKSLLAGCSFLQEYAPEFGQYLNNYPNGKLPGYEGFVYWSKEKFGLKPVISVTHVFIYPRNTENRKELLIATKQLFADHYFDSSLGFAILAEEPADSTIPGTYLIYLNQSRADALKGFLTGLRRSVVESRSLTALKNNLKLIKQRLERPAGRS
jgi:hypothetical protein